MRRLTIVVAVLGLASLAAAQPPAGADRVATANGLRLHYLEWGDPAKPPMILLHGIARHAHTFDHIAPAFARDHHVIALDMRGHGDSAWSPDGAYLVQDYVSDLVALVGRTAAPPPDAPRQLHRRPRRAGVRGPASGARRSDRRGGRRTRTPAEHRRRLRAPGRTGGQRVGDGRRTGRPARGRKPADARSRSSARTRISASSRGRTDASSGSAIQIS